ncbi:hypothetical protein AB6A40_002775 [Gnathostoma spinigerum]|uniref:Palmitoyltransferase n=1 Tax=Gnathostoma spinigerum TaxID=75299 RepID=A0ABD6EA38_9BILA
MKHETFWFTQVDEETDQQLKRITPFMKDRYIPDQSTHEQVIQQIAILNAFAASRNLRFVEVDRFQRLNYCYICRLIKPDRTHHCMSCGHCVVKYDHHCPWINKCVSYNNYKFFLLYLFYGCLCIIWSLSTSLESIVRFFVNANWSEEWFDFLQIFVCVTTQMGFGYYPLGELLWYHYKLIKVNETTCEQAKIANILNDPKADFNVGLYRNVRAVFGWGLWLIPVTTQVADGLHFPVRYSDAAIGPKYILKAEYDKKNTK